MTIHEGCEVIMNAIKTSFKKSLESRLNKANELAPGSLIKPNSFLRYSAVYITSPNKPIHEMNMQEMKNKNNLLSL
jgi:hypothetical protein